MALVVRDRVKTTTTTTGTGTLTLGAVVTLNDTSGTLYSAGAFGTPKITTAGDTVSVTYNTTATS